MYRVGVKDLLFTVLLVPTVTLLLFAIGAGVHMIHEGSKRRRDSLEAAARAHSGRIQSSFWGGDSILFEVDGVQAELTHSGGQGDAAWTKVHFDWSPPFPNRLHVAPEGAWAKLKKLMGMQEFQIGARAFDEEFLIQGQPEVWIREVLDEGLRRRLLSLSALGSSTASFAQPKGVTLDLRETGLILRGRREHVGHQADLLEFLETSVEILRALKGGGGQAVTVAIKAAVSAGKCPICSDAVGREAKRCDGCQTEYHAECWAYLGGCAIFGCGRRSPERRREGTSQW